MKNIIPIRSDIYHKYTYGLQARLKKNYYRPQTKFAKVMFLQVSVCPQGGVSGPGGSAASGGACSRGVCSRGGAWSGRGLLLGGAWSGGAWSRGGVWRPPCDGYCCGWYTSYWNAFLLWSCGKVMFSFLSVGHSVHGGGGVPMWPLSMMHWTLLYFP